MIVAPQSRCSCHCAKMYQCNRSKICAVIMTACGWHRNDHIFFAFNAVCTSNILNENKDILCESQGPAALYLFYTKVMIYKCENDHHCHCGFNVCCACTKQNNPDLAFKKNLKQNRLCFIWLIFIQIKVLIWFSLLYESVFCICGILYRSHFKHGSSGFSSGV